MVTIEASVAIARPIGAVFAYMTNPENDVLWQSGVISSKVTSEGPFGVGTMEVSEGQVFGQRVTTKYEVTAYEPDQRIEYTSRDSPIQIRAEYWFEAISETETKVVIIAEAEVGGFFKIAEPIVGRTIRRQWDTNVANLKDLLEAEA